MFTPILPTTCTMGDNTSLASSQIMPNHEKIINLENRAAVKRGLDELEKWGNRDLMKFIIDRFKVLHLI